MNAMYKTLTAAVLAAASAGAFAASNDGLPSNGTGTGVGDLMFAYEAADGTASIVWDLADGSNDLNWTDLLAATGFTISNVEVSNFISANPGGRWNIFGLTNTKTAGTGSNMIYNQAGFGVTINGAADPASATGNTGGKIEGHMDSAAGWISAANGAGLADNGTLTAGEFDAWAFSDNNHGGSSGFLAGQFATGLIGETLGYWTILIDNTVARGLSANDATKALGRAPFFTQLGNFTLGLDGSLAYSTAPVPVPAAVWLMGSALAGLGVMRRRKA
jgi:hypothetical protein